LEIRKFSSNIFAAFGFLLIFLDALSGPMLAAIWQTEQEESARFWNGPRHDSGVPFLGHYGG
jgi:hypothetical protein